jgi:putative chitinase
VVTLEQLRRICHQTPAGVLDRFVRPLNECFQACGIETVERHAAFIAQYAHETSGFTRLEENLYYASVEALIAATRPQWDALDRDDAWGYLQQPERLANRVYAGRTATAARRAATAGSIAAAGSAISRSAAITSAAARRSSSTSSSSRICCSSRRMPCAPAAGTGDRQRQPLSYTSLHDVELLTRYINGGINGLKQRTELFELALKVLRESS